MWGYDATTHLEETKTRWWLEGNLKMAKKKSLKPEWNQGESEEKKPEYGQR